MGLKIILKKLSVDHRIFQALVRVSTRVVVVVVVVRELFSLVMSAICVRIRGRGQRYEDCLPHDSSFSSTAAFSPQ